MDFRDVLAGCEIADGDTYVVHEDEETAGWQAEMMRMSSRAW